MRSNVIHVISEKNFKVLCTISQTKRKDKQTRTYKMLNSLGISILFTLSATVSGFRFSHLLKADRRLTEDGRLDLLGLAAKYDHAAETHKITTEDGYILTLFRLPGDTSRPCLFVHGNVMDPDSWILRGKDSPAIVFADRGFDTWLLSLRGTIYSKEHKDYDAEKEPSRFFDFSFHEIGIYDLTKAIDYILETTKQSKLLAVAYSFSTTAFYVMGSERPEYNEKIKALVCLAPMCYVKDLKGLARLQNIISVLPMPPRRGEEILGRDQLSSYLISSLCINKSMYNFCVKGLLFGIFGEDGSNFEKEFSATFFGHVFGATSRPTIQHFSQTARSNEFRKYDYGLRNMAKYGQLSPPKYQLSNVTMPVLLFRGETDHLSTEANVDRLSRELANVTHYQVLPKFSHLNFVASRNISEDLNRHVLREVDKLY